MFFGTKKTADNLRKEIQTYELELNKVGEELKELRFLLRKKFENVKFLKNEQVCVSLFEYENIKREIKAVEITITERNNWIREIENILIKSEKQLESAEFSVKKEEKLRKILKDKQLMTNVYDIKTGKRWTIKK